MHCMVVREGEREGRREYVLIIAFVGVESLIWGGFFEEGDEG